MQPEVAALQSKLKEILYDCAVEIRATRAALYLYDGEGKYELVTEYGFRSSIRQTADKTDPLIDRCHRARTPFFVNGLAAEPRLAELMYQAGTDRLLGAPVYLRGQLVGVIDMRDKPNKQPFEAADLPKAQRIAEQVAGLFVNKNVFNLRYITLSEMEEITAPATTEVIVPSAPAPAPAPAPALRPAPAPAPPLSAPPLAKPRRDSGVFRPRLASLILEARVAAEKLVTPAASATLSENEVAAARDVLRSMLLIPAATVVCFSAFGHLGGVQEFAARSTLTDDAVKFMQSKLNIWLTKRGESGGFTRPNVTAPFGPAAPAVTAAQVTKVFTAPVVAGSLPGLYLTVGFATAPDRAAHELLAAFLGQLQLAIEHSIDRRAVQAMRARVADTLLEPDLVRYPELRRHSNAVASRAEAFASFLGLSPDEVETARIAALVHDCGMRLLDYEKFYQKRDLTSEEMTILREHVAVSAALADPLLGAEIARIVLCHHERVDGRGYPNQLHGDDIPLLSRVIAICDAYEAMVLDTYQPAEPPQTALAKIAQGAGTQFDAELARRFGDFMRR
jgi:hypothetical protein